jgi:hypothetical protein
MKYTCEANAVLPEVVEARFMKPYTIVRQSRSCEHTQPDKPRVKKLQCSDH